MTTRFDGLTIVPGHILRVSRQLQFLGHVIYRQGSLIGQSSDEILAEHWPSTTLLQDPI